MPKLARYRRSYAAWSPHVCPPSAPAAPLRGVDRIPVRPGAPDVGGFCEEAGWHKLVTVPYELNNKQEAARPRRILCRRGTATARDGSIGRRTPARIGGSFGNIRAPTSAALDFIDGRTGFLGNVGPGYFPDVRDAHPLYVTHDAGSTWTPASITRGPPVKGICALDILRQDGKVVAIRAGGRVGGPAGLLESFDGGSTWDSRDMSAVTGMILDIHFVDARTGFIAGASEPEEDKAHARILKTVDGGGDVARRLRQLTGRRQQLEARFPECNDRLRDDHQLQRSAGRGGGICGQDRGRGRALASARGDGRTTIGCRMGSLSSTRRGAGSAGRPAATRRSMAAGPGALPGWASRRTRSASCIGPTAA